MGADRRGEKGRGQKAQGEWLQQPVVRGGPSAGGAPGFMPETFALPPERVSLARAQGHFQVRRVGQVRFTEREDSDGEVRVKRKR